MILVCVDNLGANDLTLGKHYKLIKYDSSFVIVSNDNQNEKSYYSARFKNLNIIRKTKINNVYS